MESKLFNVRCDNCGSEYRINSRGEMNCPFCGSKIYLNDKDFEAYQKARDEMLVKDKVENDVVNSDGDVLNKWLNEQTITLETENGKSVNIHYHYQYDRGYKTVYVGRKRVAIVYRKNFALENVIKNIQMIQYPSADIKALGDFFPMVGLTTALKGGRCLMVIDKPENVYPLALFNNLHPKHVAWIISRMENFGCLFEYNHVDFFTFNKLDMYINPKTHQVYILDGWEYLMQGRPYKYLVRIRGIAKDLMCVEEAPQKCLEFLESEPAETAYIDFNNWNDVIEYGFHGHNFTIFTED